MQIATPKPQHEKTDGNRIQLAVNSKLFRVISDGKLLAIVIGKWQEKYPLTIAIQDEATCINKSEMTLRRAMSDTAHLSIDDLLKIERHLGSMFLDRYIQERRRVVNGNAH